MSADRSFGDTKPRTPRWVALTAGKFLGAILLVQGCLYLSQHFRWFSFNEFKGFTVLIAVGATLVLLVFLLAWVVLDLLFRAKSQFSLATLLLIVPIVGIPLGWLAREMDLARQQRETLSSLTSRGGLTHALYDYESTTEWAPTLLPPSVFDRIVSALGTDFFTSIVDLKVLVVDDGDLETIGRFAKLRRLDIRSTLVTDAGLRHLENLTELEELRLYRANITDDGLAHLAGLTRLTTLHLDGASQVSDAGIEKLRRLAELQELGLGYTAVTDTTLQRIAWFPHLESLDLEATRVTSAGLVDLEPLRNLQELGLNHTPVGDAGVVHLATLTHLRHVRLSRTRVTDDGVKQLKEALPKCEVVR